ncbi:MAG: hypothetical protein ACRD07_06455 [Acidimicrobiales bacterium]
MAALERAGIAPRDVTLLNDVVDPGGGAARRADDRMVGWFTRRWVRGAVVGAIIGAAGFVVALVALRDGSLYPAWIGAALGGVAAGGFVGGFVAVGAALPRNPRAWDTYLLEHRDEVCLAVRLRAQTADRVPELLRREGATSIELLSGDQTRRTIL